MTLSFTQNMLQFRLYIEGLFRSSIERKQPFYPDIEKLADMVDLEVPVSFGEWFKLRRKALYLTQEELAQRSGCSVFALRKIESGERKPSKQLAGLLAASLEIRKDDQQTFIRVARGELHLERLQSPSFGLANAPVAEQRPVSSHLPLAAAPLIGRDAELAALERLFKNPQCRLLTLTGMGGIGKTRLAVEFASMQLPLFPGGVFFVSLASLNSPDLIVPAIADVFGFTFSGPTNPKDQLLNYLVSRTKQAFLLVLDNLEHLIMPYPPGENRSDAPGLVGEILQWLPNVKVLATSRERLNLQGEWMYELHGLPVPPVDFTGSLEDCGAVALFLFSARRAKADFEIQADEFQTVYRICRLLEGIPLAIELAAAWVGLLSCQEIVHEIEANLDFLSTSMRDVPERHRSIRATIDHSWKLLSDEDRRILRQLSVFHGGFSRQAAEQVAGATLSSLAALHAKSLVRRAENGRFDLHEVIRQYALSYLDSDPSSEQIRDRHSEHYLTYLSDREKALKSAAQQKAIRELTDDLDNLRAAWAWAVKQKQFALLGTSVRSLGWMYEVAGLLREGIEQLEQLIQLLRLEPHDHLWDRALGTALVQQALLSFRKGDFLRSQALYKEGIDILRPTGERAVLADALIFLATLMHLNGDYARSKSLIQEGLVCAQASNDPWFVSYGIYNLGHVDSLMGDYEGGYKQMIRGLEGWRALGDPHSIALGLNFLVSTLIKLGHYEEAKAFMHESIALCEETKNLWGMGTAYRYLGLATLAEGEYMEAQTHFRKSLEIFVRYFEGWDIARSLTYLGDAVLMSGDLAEAEKNYLDALRLSLEAKTIPIALDALVGLARVHLCHGDIERAFELASYVMNHTATTQETRDISSQLIRDAEQQLDAHRIQAIREKSLHQSLEGLYDIARS